MTARRSIDIDTYAKKSQNSPCFICQIRDEDPTLPPHHIVYRDDQHMVFLNRFPTLLGYVLVAPIEHYEQVTGDIPLSKYLGTQALIYHTAEAVRAEVPTERLYVLSLGSQQGNRHVHWHIAPLPPGVPYLEQQYAALDLERGVLEIPDDEMQELAARLRARLSDLLGA